MGSCIGIVRSPRRVHPIPGEDNASLIERLRYSLPHRTAAPVPPPPPPPSRGRVGFIGFPLRYYLAASAIALGLFAALRLVSAREVARSNLAEYCHYHDEGGAP